jgi:endonuclease I
MIKNSLLIVLSLFAGFTMAQTEPTSQPSNLNFSSIKTYRVSVSFSSAGADGHLMVVSKDPITFTPVDNTTYLKGQNINGAKVVSVGSGTFTFFKNLLQNNSYNVAVFAYNEQGANINYKSDNPLTSAVTTASAGFGNYYSGIDFNSSNLVGALTNLIQPHTSIDYGQFDENIVAGFYETDTVLGGLTQKYIICQYSGEHKVYTGPFSYQGSTPFYSREHRAAKSWYDFTGLGGSITGVPEGNDIHSLDLVQNDVNTARSNNPFGEVTGNPWSNSYLEFIIGKDDRDILVVEPMENRKGDVARAHFYMLLTYNGKYGQNWGLDNLLTLAQSQDYQVLLDWHYNDLPDDFEKTRHEYVYEIQGNRNPLIDFPQLLDCIDFRDMTKQANCDVRVGIAENLANKYGTFIYPNPSTGILYMQDVKAKDVQGIHIFNMLGVEQNNFSLDHDSIHVEQLNKGLYIISIETKKKNYISKFQLN